jgi:hypothetical protein
VSLIERVLMWAFPYQDILRDGTQDLYLRRFFIYPRNKDFSQNKGKRRVYLHKFYRGDEDLHLHDHPWPFTSFILTRGYWEETPWRPDLLGWKKGDIPTDGQNGEWRFKRFYRPFSILKRPAVWQHRVILKDKKPVWTIVRTGVKERSWGFIINGKQCPWQRYDGRVGICNDTVEETQ